MYKNLADVYDVLMEDMPYTEWAGFLDAIIADKASDSKKILDLGSGTGSISILLSQKGYQLTNLDFSEEMISQAKKKYNKAQAEADFVTMDIRDIKYQEEFDVAMSTFDTLNYFTDQEELAGIFKSTFDAVKPGGIFVFDMNTKYKFKKILGEEVYTYNTDDLVYIWENYYDSQDRIIDIDLSFFLKKEGSMYERFQEHHIQKYYPVSEVKNYLKKAGFTAIDVYQDLEFKKPEKKGIRNFFVARKPD